ncbi:MAG: hypothetical protein Q4C50_08255 [Eubacteriales bacterium]|nr:hypothetical protein [Eubacteriales bacterium]
MKVLDAAVNVQNRLGIQTLAYCVLDNEIHMILQAEEKEDIHKFPELILQRYKKSCLSDTDDFAWFSAAVSPCQFRKPELRELKDEACALRCCIKLHMMPVSTGIAASPGDYWWSSYTDYLGRKWIALTDTQPLLIWLSPDERTAVRMMKRKHEMKRAAVR